MTHTKLPDIEDTEKNEDITFGYDNFLEVKPIVIEHLHKHKVSSVTVMYSGGNDEGGPDKVKVLFRDGTDIDISNYHYENLYDALCTPVYYEYSDFAIEGHANGEIRWVINYEDKEKSKVLLTGSQSYEHWEAVDKEL